MRWLILLFCCIGCAVPVKTFSLEQSQAAFKGLPIQVLPFKFPSEPQQGGLLQNPWRMVQSANNTLWVFQTPQLARDMVEKNRQWVNKYSSAGAGIILGGLYYLEPGKPQDIRAMTRGTLVMQNLVLVSHRPLEKNPQHTMQHFANVLTSMR